MYDAGMVSRALGSGWKVRRRQILGLTVALLCFLPVDQSLIAQAAGQDVGKIRSIHRGLTVQPSGARKQPGRAQQHLLSAESLETLKAQQASLGLKDGTILAMNQRTDVILQAPELTVVKSGDVAAMDAPGSHYRIQTDDSVASAVGTRFDVRIVGPHVTAYPGQTEYPPGTTTVSVVAGVVVVSNHAGYVRVGAGEWTHVIPGKAPSTPTRHNAQLDLNWAGSLLPGG